MSDLINPVGSQGLSPPTALLAQAGAKASTPAATTVAGAEAQSIQDAAAASQAAQSDQAAKLELSSNPQASAAPSDKPMTMAEAAQAFQEYLNSLPSDLQFQPDYEAGLVVFKVVNPVTQKVIRQLPPEDVVNQARSLRLAEKQNHSGILLDQSL